MIEAIQIGELAIQVARKDIRNVHLTVHPPDGRVTLSAPERTRLEVLRAYAATRLGWIRQQQEKLAGQARETPRLYIKRESHYLWGRRHLLAIEHREARPCVSLNHRTITLNVRPMHFADCIHEMTGMFEPQAAAKGTRAEPLNTGAILGWSVGLAR